MDRQERHQQQKEKQRDQKNKQEQVYEDQQQKQRLPLHPFWFVIGAVLVLLAVYTWTIGIW
jgi:hypothetical protein